METLEACPGPAYPCQANEYHFLLVASLQSQGCLSIAGTALASEFSRHVNTAGLRSPLEHRGPTPMLSPCAVVAAQMDALQMNDWPDTDAGVRTAFLFSKPYDCENMLTGRVRALHRFQAEELCRRHAGTRAPFC